MKFFLAQPRAVVLKGSYVYSMKLLADSSKRQGRTCSGYQVAAGSAIWELAIPSEKVHVRAKPEVLFRGAGGLELGLGRKATGNLQSETGRNG